MIKILIAEDDKLSLKMLETFLKKCGYETITVSDGRAALSILNSDNRPDLAIIDWMMPEIDGIEVCRKLRSEKKEPYIYFILLTSKNEKQDIVAGLEAGADDYIVKPFDNQELKVRIRAGERILELQSKLLSAYKELNEIASHDQLTGIYNRHAILNIFNKEISRASRENQSISVIMADIDHFKKVNDTYGHLVGDEILKQVIKRISSILRNYDTIGRYGGEEFLMFIPRADEKSAEKICERICSGMTDSLFITSGGGIKVTISLGVHTVKPGKDCNPELLIKKADSALYKAKENGRNGFCFYTEPFIG